MFANPNDMKLAKSITEAYSKMYTENLAVAAVVDPLQVDLEEVAKFALENYKVDVTDKADFEAMIIKTLEKKYSLVTKLEKIVRKMNTEKMDAK